MIRSIETARIFDFEEFPKRDKVGVEFGCRQIFFFFLVIVTTLIIDCHYFVLIFPPEVLTIMICYPGHLHVLHRASGSVQ